MTAAGAQAALRGYRLQALYTLHRILEGGDELVFKLEGREDLDVLSSTGELLEVIQVKAHEDNLTLSTLSPQKHESFFKRALARRSSHPLITERLVSFGPFGPDMECAWSNAGREREEAIQLLERAGYARSQALELINHIKLNRCEEKTIEELVLDKLKGSLLGVDPRAAFELLHTWLFLAAEAKATLTYKDTITRILDVGRFISERNAYHGEWFTSIIPLDSGEKTNAETLHQEFYRGVGARYAHITAGVDVPRNERLRDIENAFSQARVVIIRGSSGQGKSALAYRYLHDYVPEEWRFEVRLIENRIQALRIASALLGHLNAIGVPAYVYLEVEPGNIAWIDLTQQLVRFPLVRVLVTIREEDWRRVSVTGSMFDFREVELRLNQAEAQRIFDHLAQHRKPSHVLSFEEAWARFGQSGPLLEFAYFIVQKESLRDRLTMQVTRLRDDVRNQRLEPEELELLRRVSIAAAYGARLDVLTIRRDLKLRDARRTLDRYEQEFLLRVGVGGRYLEGLHPIRSAILSELLTGDVLEPWAESAAAAIRSMAEQDLESFLLHAFSRRRAESQSLLETLACMAPQTWTGLAGILRAMLWIGARQYVDRNMELIRETSRRFGGAWKMILLPNVNDYASDATGMSPSPYAQMDFIPEENRRAITLFRQRLTPPPEMLDQAREWLSRGRRPVNTPKDPLEWTDMADVSFWAAYLQSPSAADLQPSEQEYRIAATEIPLQNAADLVYALSFFKDDTTRHRLESIRPTLLERFQRETKTPVISYSNNTICAHFLIDPSFVAVDEEVSQRKTAAPTNFLHTETMVRVELLRRLFPSFEVFAAQGYGHGNLGFELPFDETSKSVQSIYLPPVWLVRLNAWFLRLADYAFRPASWEDYARVLHHTRLLNLQAMEALIIGLNVYFRSEGPYILEAGIISEERWSEALRAVQNRPMLPRDAVDEWGFTSEDMPKDEDRHSQSTEAWLEPVATALIRHRPLINSIRDFFGKLENFYLQAPKAFGLALQRGKGNLLSESSSVDTGQYFSKDSGHLPTINLSDALRSLCSFQLEFGDRLDPFFAASELSVVEKKERERILRAFCLWHYFTKNFLRSKIRQPSQDAGKEFEESQKLSLRRLNTQLKALKPHGVRAVLQLADPQWSADPALWVTFDVDDATLTYDNFVVVYRSLVEALRHGSSLGTVYHAVLLTWPTVHVVPLIRGRAIAHLSWQFTSMALMLNPPVPEKDVLSFILKPIPESAWARLGLATWDHPRLTSVTKVYIAAVQLASLVGHFSSIGGLPDADDIGNALLQTYAEEQSERIRKSSQMVSLALGAIASYVREHREHLEERPHLVHVIDLLIHAESELIPEDAVGTIHLDFVGIHSWAGRIRAVLPEIDRAGLHWINDVLDEVAKG